MPFQEWTDKASRFCPDKRFPTDTVDRIKRRKEAAEKAVAKGTAKFVLEVQPGFKYARLPR